VNNDYGVGIGTTFVEAYKALGGEVTANEKHEEKKNSYRSELATLAAGGAEALVVVAYAGDSGSTIVKQSIEGGLFKKFIGTDGLRDEALIKEIGADALKDSFFSSPTSPADNPAQKTLHDLYNAAFKEGADKAFVDQTYDATFLVALAIEKAGSADRAKIAAALREVASAPGEKVGPGEWAKAKALIKEGKDIDYDGAGGGYDFDKMGDVQGFIGKFVVDGTKYKQVGIFQ
jgi:branched-chain amino acid transport system substrate-binding protein